MKKFLLVVSLALAFTLVACDEFFNDFFNDDFFTSSLGTDYVREYEVENITVTANNIGNILNAVIGNPEAALAVTESLVANLESIAEEAPEVRAALMDGGVKLSIEASGVGTSVIVNAFTEIENLVSGEGDATESLQDLVESILSDFSENNGAAAAANLALILGVNMDGVEDGQAPALDPNYIAQASPNDIALAVVVLSLAVFEDVVDSIDEGIGDLEGFIEEFAGGIGFETTAEGTFLTVTGETTPEVLALAACLNLLANTTDPRFTEGLITSQLAGLFGMIQ